MPNAVAGRAAAASQSTAKVGGGPPSLIPPRPYVDQSADDVITSAVERDCSILARCHGLCYAFKTWLWLLMDPDIGSSRWILVTPFRYC
jgi:hypothetical protein